jgi:hypothetical protein
VYGWNPLINNNLAFGSLRFLPYPSMYLKVHSMSSLDQIGLLVMEMKIKIFNDNRLVMSLIGRRACKS